MVFKEESNYNKVSLGSLGPAFKSIVLEEAEFKKDLAPFNAEIERFERKGKNFVRMTYRL